MTPKLKLVGFIVCATVLGATQARATTYTYTGLDYTTSGIMTEQITPPPNGFTTSMSITGSFTTALPLPAGQAETNILPLVQSFSFFDGLDTITNTTTNLFPTTFQVGTDASGNISQWQINIATHYPTTPPQIGALRFSISISSVFGDQALLQQCANPEGDINACDDENTDAANVASGSWSTATPLPAALPLFATGVGGLGLLGWRRKRKAQAV